MEGPVNEHHLPGRLLEPVAAGPRALPQPQGPACYWQPEAFQVVLSFVRPFVYLLIHLSSP